MLDYFTPYNQGTLDDGDTDVASGGLVLLPPLPSGLQLLAQQGKQGTVYLLNTSNLGKYCVNLTPACTSSDPQIVQEIKGATAGIWGSPAYWNGNLYWAGANDSLQAFSFDAGGSGLISTSPTSQSALIFSFPGASPTVSANGTTNGIVWAQGSSTLYAYDATNLTNLLYTSNQAANSRDAAGATVKFVPPVIANGKVYLGTQSALVTYGLLASTLPVAASPTLSPPPGSYTSAQSVTLTDTTPGAVIFYTTNGTTPTVNSTLYTGTALQISSATTVEAIAVAGGYQSSPVTIGAYGINAQGTTSISVNLATVDAVDGIANTGTATTGGGMDGFGYDYSAALLGTSLSWGGSTFTFGAAGIADAVSSTTIALPAGNDSTVNLLATAVDGAQLAQTFIVTYTDGTTSTFKQSLSDWFVPQNFAGESQALKMAYRIATSGATSPGPLYLYGYSFALNSAKTVQSLTLPNNRHVVVLAVDVSPAGSSPPPPPPAASPTLSPPPGSYTSAQSVTLADTTPGAVIYYTINGTAPTVNSTKYTSGTPVSISSTTTLEAIASASGYSNSAVSSGTYAIGSQGTTPISVSLAAVDDVDGIANTGTAPPGGGMDTDSYAYSSTLLGTSLIWGGSTFTFGAAGVADAVSNATIALPAGNDSSLSVLATAVDGTLLAQTFVVTYTDGTTSTFNQNLSDWFYPQNYAGESQALKMAYRIAPSGATSAGPVYLYGYSFALNSAKTVQSLTLPNNRRIVVLAVDVSPAGSAPPPAASPTLSPPPGSYTSAQSVTLTDTTPGAVIYYTTNGTAPTLGSAQYSPGTPVSISSTTTLEAIAVASGYSNSAVSGGTYTIGSQGTTPISVTLAAVDDVHGIANTGTAPAGGGLDTDGYAYSATLLGTSLIWGGSSFTLGAAGVADAVSSTTIALPAGNDTTLNILATGVNGGQTGQSFVVTYTDGTTSTFKQNLSDWFAPQNYAGESQVLKMAYRIAPSGATSAGPVYLYGYSFALNSAKTVQSLTLPNNRNVVVLAVDLTP